MLQKDRRQKMLNPELVKGPWSKEEDEVMIELMNIIGPKKWSTIAQHLPGRIRKQWTELTKFLLGRADNAIKNHWNSSVKEKLDSYLASCLHTQHNRDKKNHTNTLSSPFSLLPSYCFIADGRWNRTEYLTNVQLCRFMDNIVATGFLLFCGLHFDYFYRFIAAGFGQQRYGHYNMLYTGFWTDLFGLVCRVVSGLGQHHGGAEFIAVFRLNCLDYLFVLLLQVMWRQQQVFLRFEEAVYMMLVWHMMQDFWHK
ncbi:unnamed protein product [Vicia faba]|uniref:Uncharacterized protein n=1 Tax=Vicia faba TaxID=3906 RepID=A0AAV0ZQT1_VICFA|nr:unnamed protein product [Vicia faba]